MTRPPPPVRSAEPRSRLRLERSQAQAATAAPTSRLGAQHRKLRPWQSPDGLARPPDFWRDVHCIFGLPFDATTRAATVERLREAARHGRRLFLSTPNLNFAVGCRSDAAFRDSVVRSDLSTPDGAPILWLARLMRAPLIERVTGADVFERLVDSSGHSVAVYFFGGAEGVAERAARQLNASGRPGAHVVGHQAPGFADAEAMSGPAYTDPINAAGAEFVVVALGARKGQQWIQRNRAALNAPVVSHLGAVVNFVAGTVKRSPRWLQDAGLEWLWRIREEPGLWRRYWDDGRAMLRYLLGCALPWALFNAPARASGDADLLRVERVRADGVTLLRLSGDADNGPALDDWRVILTEEALRTDPVELDMRDLRRVDSGFIALLQLLEAWQRSRGACVTLRGVTPRVARAFRWAGAAYLLEAPAALTRRSAPAS